MNLNLIYLRIWLCLMVAFVVISFCSRKARGRKMPPSQDFFVAACTLGGVITMLRVVFKVFTQEALQTSLEWDGMVVVCASSLWIVFFGLKEIVKLF